MLRDNNNRMKKLAALFIGLALLGACSNQPDPVTDREKLEADAPFPKAVFVSNLVKNVLSNAELWQAPKLLNRLYRMNPADLSENYRIEVLMDTPWGGGSSRVFIVGQKNVDIDPLFIQNLDAAIEQSMPQANDTHPKLQANKRAFLADRQKLIDILVSSQVLRKN